MAKFEKNQIIPINHQGEIAEATITRRVRKEDLDTGESWVHYDYIAEQDNMGYVYKDIKESILESRYKTGLRLLNGETFPLDPLE